MTRPALTLRLAAPALAVALLAAAPGTAGAQDFNLKKLEFIAGCGSARVDKDRIVEENWTSVSDNLMLATTRYLNKGKGFSFEFTKIEKTDSGVVFVASTEFKEPSTYRMTTLSDEFAVWENRGKDFPQRIMYRLASDGALIARNELIEGYDPRNTEIRLQPVKCPGKEKK